MGHFSAWERFVIFLKEPYYKIRSLKYKMISWKEYPADGLLDKKVLFKIYTVPFRVRMDYDRRNRNVVEGRKLCERCEGTGNELFACYRECENCNGIGYIKGAHPCSETKV